MHVTVWATEKGRAAKPKKPATWPPPSAGSVPRQHRHPPKPKPVRLRKQLHQSGASHHWRLERRLPGRLRLPRKTQLPLLTPADPAQTTDASELCDPTLDRQVAHADSLQTSDPAAAAAAWARLDRTLTDRAILVPTVTFKETDVLSRRVGNYQYHLLWGPIVDQLWVR